jgi:hypothetical protein
MTAAAPAFVVSGRNVNETWYRGAALLAREGEPRGSRAGNVLEVPVPVLTVTERPLERVLFDARRDANPFFHFFESLWMLDGRDDVDFPARFVKRMRSFSDDGAKLYGAYGARWRSYFDFDQLERIVENLVKTPGCRRQVLTMWDPEGDLLAAAPDDRDHPCNTHVYFKLRDDALVATVCCRSNDIVWGLYGSNVVHFAYLLEYVAARIGAEVGPLYQLSDSFHAYRGVFDAKAPHAFDGYEQPYALGTVAPYPLVEHAGSFDYELGKWMDGNLDRVYRNRIFDRVATPMLEAHDAYRAGDLPHALEHALRIEATDWSLACTRWLYRRASARKEGE